MSNTITQTYRDNTGLYQSHFDKLIKLTPVFETIPGKSNKKLEKFRKALNVYYDMYNNGLNNRACEFKGAFGFAAGLHKDTTTYGSVSYGKNCYARMEQVMNTLVAEAALEQRIVR